MPATNVIDPPVTDPSHIRPAPQRRFNRRLDRALPALVLAGYVLLAVLYSFVNPLFEAGDEFLHYPVVKSLADGAGLPVQPENPLVYGYLQEGSQPPLYYLLAALLIRPIETGPPGPGYELNPHAIVGSPHALGNKNIVLAQPDRTGTAGRVALAAHLIRLLSVVIGAGAVVATWLLARQILPDAPAVAWFAAAWVAFLPEFLFVASSINNDILAISLASLALVAINWAAGRPADIRPWIVVGILGGLAALSKLNAAGVVGLAILTIAWRVRTTPERRWAPGALAAVVLIPTVLAGWWYVRNLFLYSDPTGLSAMYDIVQRRNLDLAGLLGELSSIHYSFWGILGGFNVALPEWLYWVYDGLALAAVAGLVYGAIRRRATWRRQVNLLPLALALIWLAVIAAALVRWTQSTMGSQGRLLFPALAVIAILLAWGWPAWFDRRHRTPVLATITAVLFVAAALVPWLAIRPAYAEPRRLPAEAAAQVPNALRASFAGVDLVGYRIGRPDGTLAEARPGEPLAVTLYWQARQPLPENWSVYVHLLDRSGRVLGQSNSYPGAGAYPFRRFTPGEIVEDVAYLTVDPGAPVPTLARLETGLYRYHSLERLPATGERALAHGSVFLGDLRIPEPETPPALANPVGRTFGEQIELVDFARRDATDAGQPARLEIDLRWRALQDLSVDYTVFLHVIDGNGRVIAQADREPHDGTYPTSVWRAGEIVQDRQSVTLPPDLPAGVYDLKIGLYRRDTGERLPVPGIPDAAVPLRPVAPGGS